MAEGLLHFFEGWIIFLACAGLLAAEIYLLARVPPRGSFFDVVQLPNVEAIQPKLAAGSGSTPLPLLACLLLLLAAGVAAHQVSNRQEIIPERVRFVGFPAQLGDWQGRQSLLDRSSNTTSVSTTTFFRTIAAETASRSISTSPTTLRSEAVSRPTPLGYAFQATVG